MNGSKTKPRFLKTAAALTILLLLASGFACFFVVNTTPSYPVGIYQKFDREPRMGDLALFCPADNEVTFLAHERQYFGAGFCPGNYGYLIKKILAAKMDRAEFTDAGVLVNGIFISNSRPRTVDKAGRPLPQLRGAYVLGDGEVLMMSDYNADSWDGRYFGLIDKQQIRYVLEPVITFE
jgi:conjugative transfer signal peptidase TraF